MSAQAVATPFQRRLNREDEMLAIAVRTADALGLGIEATAGRLVKYDSYGRMTGPDKLGPILRELLTALERLDVLVTGHRPSGDHLNSSQSGSPAVNEGRP